MREFRPRAEPEIGRGVFETVLVLDGHPLEWRRHRERLECSCRDLYGARLDAGALDRRVAALATGHRRSRLRVVARPAVDGGLATDAAIASLDAQLPQAGGPVLAPVRVRAGYGRHKLVDRDWLERLEAFVPGGTRPLLITGTDDVLETTRANLLAIRGDAVWTPPLDGSILPGVVRAVAIEQAHRLGIKVREETLALDELREADVVMLTGSLRLAEWRALHSGGAAEEIAIALALAVRRLPGTVPGGGGAPSADPE